MKTIAERLTRAREAKGLNKSQLATKSGLTPSAIGNIESGIRKSKASLYAIAQVLGVRYEWLANGDGPMEPTTQQFELVAEPANQRRNSTELSPAAIELAKLYDLIPEADLIRRNQAYTAASMAILDVVQAK